MRKRGIVHKKLRLAKIEVGSVETPEVSPAENYLNKAYKLLEEFAIGMASR